MFHKCTTSSPQPRVLMITALFHPAVGGTERQALNLSRALQNRGISVQVLTRALDNLPARETIGNVPIYRSIKVFPAPLLFGLSYFLTVMRFIIARRHSFDILHCHILQNYHSIAAVLAKWLLGKKVIIKVAATGPLSDIAMAKKSLLGSCFLLIVRHADAVIALCRQSEEEIVAAGVPKNRIAKITNGVDTDFFRPAAAACPAPCRLLFIGRLDHMKGIDVLLDAVALLKAENHAVTCDIVGDGPLKAELHKKALQLGIAPMVNFTGACSEVLTFLHGASIFILPSRSEGFPNVILEAMACGMPIIATSVGGIPDIVQNGFNGLLIAPNDARALCSAVVRLISDRELAARIGKQARTDVLAQYSLEKTTDTYTDLYQSLFDR